MFTVRYEKQLTLIVTFKSHHRPVHNTSSVRLLFVVEKVALGENILPVLLFLTVSTIPPTLHFPCQYLSTKTPLPLSVPFHQHSTPPVSTFPPTLHSPCQYLSINATLPLSLPFHQRFTPRQYHSTSTPLHLSVPFHQHSTPPVSTIPPTLHSPRQYLSTYAPLSLSVPFHQSSIPPVSTFPPTLHSPLSVPFHQHSTFPCQYLSTNAPHAFSSTCCS